MKTLKEIAQPIFGNTDYRLTKDLEEFSVALLAELEIEKKSPKDFITTQQDVGWNSAIDAYEEKKKELFK